MSITVTARFAASQVAWLHQIWMLVSGACQPTDLKHVLNIAHRGASGGYPENTLAAFAAAIEVGAAMCELDVHLTGDGVPVVIHDETIERTTDRKGAVAAMTLRELRKADAGIRFAAQFAGERIPTLEEVFRLTAGRCGLNIELKGEGTEAAVCGLLALHDAIATTIVSSFDWPMIGRVRAIDPRIRIGLLAQRGARRLLDEADAMGAVAIHPRVDMITAELCSAAHRQNLKVYTWTCDDPVEMRQVIAAGVDGIITNYPDRLSSVLVE